MTKTIVLNYIFSQSCPLSSIDAVQLPSSPLRLFFPFASYLFLMTIYMSCVGLLLSLFQLLSFRSFSTNFPYVSRHKRHWLLFSLCVDVAYISLCRSLFEKWKRRARERESIVPYHTAGFSHSCASHPFLQLYYRILFTKVSADAIIAQSFMPSPCSSGHCEDRRTSMRVKQIIK